MKREELLREIARLDEEINRTVAEAELPRHEYRLFPFGTWLFAGLLFAWANYGDRIPGAYIFHTETATYAIYLGWIFVAIALYSTLRWMFAGRGYSSSSGDYMKASQRARELQERRRDLQSELRALSRE